MNIKNIKPIMKQLHDTVKCCQKKSIEKEIIYKKGVNNCCYISEKRLYSTQKKINKTFYKNYTFPRQ